MSTDTPFAHEAFARQLELNFDLLSDYNREAARALGVERDQIAGWYSPCNTRAAFLIDREGVVRHAWVTEDTLILPDPDELLAAARSLD